MRALRGEGTYMKAWVHLFCGFRQSGHIYWHQSWKKWGYGRRGTVHDVWLNLVTYEPSSQTSVTQQSTNKQQYTSVLFLVLESLYLCWGSQNDVMRLEFLEVKICSIGWKMWDYRRHNNTSAKSICREDSQRKSLICLFHHIWVLVIQSTSSLQKSGIG